MIESRNRCDEGQSPPNVIIKVNRNVNIRARDFDKSFRAFRNPELQTFGPDQFFLGESVIWYHKGQLFEGGMPGHVICDHLHKTCNLKMSLGVHDALEIENQKDIDVFRYFSNGNVIFFWKSVVFDYAGSLFVYCLFEIGGKIGSTWVNVGKLVGFKRSGIFFKKFGVSELSLD